ncbi:MAG TPA: Asp-tRNA(Asn)/Glu-tRNA(Gln) amidotransferase subunit GatB [Planctomycetota bacterium]|nr:Asp-tRNA(Asn)/Glu-tRNA(Gln) amidotransferase subunit GatB [Planctomycetota bacterium]
MAKSRTDPTEGTPFEAVIGLEVHAQLKTRTKIFCGCENRFGAEPNTLTCPVCLGQPGALPVVNRAAVEYAMLVGLAAGSEIARFTKFDRKNYYYPDLPKNYQISQFDLPLCTGGFIDVYVRETKRRIGLTRIHLEEDAGKNIHAEGRAESWIDLNRAGVPLLEIVSRPDLRTPEEAGAYLKMLRLMLLYLGVSDCNMEEGSLRCDVNASIRPRGAANLETRTEIKNLNSFTNVENALSYEIGRQIKLRTGGGEVVQQTLLFDPGRQETRVLRGKEEAHDYRYFPEPDLAPLTFTAEEVERLRSVLPEMPVSRFERFQSAFGLAAYHADVLVRDPGMAGFFEECVRLYAKPEAAQAIANWVVNAVREEANTRGGSVADSGMAPARLVELIRAIDEGKVSNQKARDVFKAMMGTAEPVGEIIRSLGLEQISDDAPLRVAVEEVIAAHPGPVEDVRKGKKNSINFLVGQVMKKTRGQANPPRVAKMIEEALAAR